MNVDIITCILLYTLLDIAATQKFKISNFDDGNNSSQIIHVLLNMLFKIHVKCHDYLELCIHKLKMPILSKSMAINLPFLNKYTRKSIGAQLHMLSNIPVKLKLKHLELHMNKVKMVFFTKLSWWAVTVLNESSRKTLGTQLHMLTIISVTMHNTSFDSAMFNKSTKQIFKQYLNYTT